MAYVKEKRGGRWLRAYAPALRQMYMQITQCSKAAQIHTICINLLLHKFDEQPNGQPDPISTHPLVEQNKETEVSSIHLPLFPGAFESKLDLLLAAGV